MLQYLRILQNKSTWQLVSSHLVDRPGNRDKGHSRTIRLLFRISVYNYHLFFLSKGALFHRMSRVCSSFLEISGITYLIQVLTVDMVIFDCLVTFSMRRLVVHTQVIYHLNWLRSELTKQWKMSWQLTSTRCEQ